MVQMGDGVSPQGCCSGAGGASMACTALLRVLACLAVALAFVWTAQQVGVGVAYADNGDANGAGPAIAVGTQAVAIAEDAPWRGAGTEADPYQISTADDLRALSTQTNSTRKYRGKYFALTNDIDLGNKAFTPIGTSDFHFMGTFDGCGHTIKRLKVNVASTYAGLFGYVSEYDSDLGGLFPAVIKNFTLEGSVASTSAFVGGVVGYATRDTTIENVVNKASVYGPIFVGGIVGKASIQGDGMKLIVRNCENYGAVECDSRVVGGIVGEFDGSYSYTVQSRIEGCANFGTVTSFATYENSVAGIVGSVSVNPNNKGLDILNCYSTGAVSAGKPYDADEDPVPYGIVGTFPTGVASVFTITNCYSTITPYDPAKSTDARITDVSVKTAAEMATDEFKQQIRQGKVPDPLPDNPPDLSDVHISTAEGWRQFADAVNGGESYKGRTVYLDADINLTGQSVEPVGSCSSFAYYGGNYFMGTFDGQGNAVTIAMQGTDQVGLFGFVCGTQYGGTGVATIKNLVVRGSVSGTTQYVGGVCGAAAHAVFENVRSEVAVTCSGIWDEAHVGGFAGWASSTARFSKCAARGQVNAPNSGCVGGFAGSFTYRDSLAPTLSNCYATGSVTGGESVGGLVGRCMVLSDYSSGFSLVLSSCYAANVVTGVSKAGAVLGSMDVPYAGTSDVAGTNVFFDAQLAGTLPAVGAGAEASGVSGVQTLNLKLAASELGDAYRANATDANGSYPLLAWETSGSALPDGSFAQAVIDAIDAIGAVSLDDEQAIASARAAYDALDAQDKASVDAARPGVLAAAEQQLAELKAAQPQNPAYCTVRFDSAGGSAVAAARVQTGRTVKRPADPERAGFTFTGWQLNGSAYDFSTPVTGNITIVATWKAADAGTGSGGESGSAGNTSNAGTDNAGAGSSGNAGNANNSSSAGNAGNTSGASNTNSASNGGKTTNATNTSAAKSASKSSKSSTSSTAKPVKQTIKGKVKKPTLQASKLAKSKQVLKVSKLVKITGAKTKLTYSKAKGSSARFKVNKKTGALTVKKGTKKGTYVLKLKVSASKSAAYKAASKTFTVKVKVK